MQRTILLISGHPEVVRACVRELSEYERSYRVVTAHRLDQANRLARQNPPDVIFLDETALEANGGRGSLEAAAKRLIELAPVVVAAAPQRQSELTSLITAGAVDFVARMSHFAPVAAGLLDRRARLANRGELVQFAENEPPADFGEILRHEVNNPLTGILGNTELLLSRADRLPPGAVERLRTIAELAVRLRETVRRLSNSCDEHHEAARPA